MYIQYIYTHTIYIYTYCIYVYTYLYVQYVCIYIYYISDAFHCLTFSQGCSYMVFVLLSVSRKERWPNALASPQRSLGRRIRISG